MKLNIEHSGEIGAGNFPDFLQFTKTDGQQFYIRNGEIYGKASTKIDNGEFDTITWLSENNISPPNDLDISRLELKTLTGFGIVGSYLNSNNKQVMLIYEFQQDMSEYLNSGSIKFTIDNPIASFTLALENPIDKETEIEGAVAINEKTSILTPGAKVIFSFTAGDDLEDVELGSYYIDKSSYDVTSETARADGRNLIGKALKDQTLNENFNINYDTIYNIINNLLDSSNLQVDDFEVQSNNEQRRYEFNPNTEVLSALDEILKSLVDWKMEETTQGEILIGSPSFSLFPTRGIYSFYRNKDIFSRQINKDDAGSYKKVCVHTQDWSVRVYREVATFSGWNLQSNKTLFVNIADGTSLEDANAIAQELANRLENVGKIESFNGPFRPQLLVGDSANIIAPDGTTSLGLITEITHNFGKQGFYTSFTVDSGGRLGRGRLSDFISQIAKVGTVGSIAYSDIIPEQPTLADLTEYNTTLASVTQANYTPESWAVYQGVVNANVMTANNTQTQVDLAAIKIQIAQNKLVTI